MDPAGAYHLDLEHRSSSAGTRGNQFGELEVDMFCCAYGATRRAGRAVLAGDASSDTTASLFREDAPLVDVEEWFLQADYARRTVSAAESRFHKVKETLLQLLKEVDDLRIVGLDQAPPQPAVEVHTPYGWVRPHQLSLGHRTLLAWVIDLAHQLFARYPTSENPLAEPVVVLVDEIDLHLHPRWQRSLMAYLGDHFPGAQFIVTAHSPLVVQAVPDANLVVVAREEGADHVTIHNDPEAVRGWRVDQILTSDLFGLESARPPAQTQALERRRQLLRNDHRSEAEEAELERLERQIEQMPQGENAEDIEAWELVHRFAEQLRSGKVARR
jgi:predicted ATP-binding protein involved in virulence